VSKEIEVKIRLSDSTGVRNQILAANAVRLSGRHFEDNLVLDLPDGLLSARQSLLRLRYTSEGGLVTFKGPPEVGSPFKIREELETAVAHPELLLQIFERLGFRVRFRYQKYREEFAIGSGGMAVHVALDDTPIGSYVELEGCQDAIRVAAAAIGFREAEFLRDSYYSLYLKHCAERGDMPEYMVFRDPAL
jgi:adenylate cyclase, class 2